MNVWRKRERATAKRMKRETLTHTERLGHLVSAVREYGTRGSAKEGEKEKKTSLPSSRFASRRKRRSRRSAKFGQEKREKRNTCGREERG